MIDYLALALGHGLLVVALLRLVMRDRLDVDPLLAQLRQDVADNRKTARLIRAGRDDAAGGEAEQNEAPPSPRQQGARARAKSRPRARPSARAGQS